MSISIFRNSARANFQPWGQHKVRISRKDKARVLIHEMGHWIQQKSARVHREAQAFYARRTAGEPLQRLRNLQPQFGYKFSEVTRVDKFSDPYIGKWYGANQQGEIISMGVDMLYTDPLKFALNDPDYFDFIVRMLRGLPGELPG